MRLSEASIIMNLEKMPSKVEFYHSFSHISWEEAKELRKKMRKTK